VAQAEKLLPNKHEALSSNPSITKNNNNKQTKTSHLFFFFFFFFGSLNSGLRACRAGILLLEPHLQHPLPNFKIKKE
jgi:hypothetical protein